MVFVDGAPLRQILSRSELEDADSRFFASEETDELIIQLAPTTDPAGAPSGCHTTLVEDRPSRENITIGSSTWASRASPRGRYRLAWTGV
jgi:hypothetical protein